MKYWLHRIKHHQEISRPLLERGFLTIGFSDFSNMEGFLSKEESAFAQAFQDSWGEVSRRRFNLWRFLHEMNEEDWVLVPGYKTYSVYEITGCANPIGMLPVSDIKTWSGHAVDQRGDLLYDGLNGQDPIDLGFFRSVRLHRMEDGPEAKDIPRYEYADAALTKRMKYQGATVEISDLKASIERSLSHFRKQQPLSLYSRLEEETTGSWLKLVREELTPDKFEALIKWYLESIGAKDVDILPKIEGDKAGDADVIATFGPLKVIVYVQAKFHLGGTSEWSVEQIDEHVENERRKSQDEYTRVSWVVSTCDHFTKGCEEKAREKGVTLIDGLEFTRMLMHAGIDGLEKAFNQVD